jgi:hypothetical protein
MSIPMSETMKIAAMMAAADMTHAAGGARTPMGPSKAPKKKKAKRKMKQKSRARNNKKKKKGKKR